MTIDMKLFIEASNLLQRFATDNGLNYDDVLDRFYVGEVARSTLFIPTRQLETELPDRIGAVLNGIIPTREIVIATTTEGNKDGKK